VAQPILLDLLGFGSFRDNPFRYPELLFSEVVIVSTSSEMPAPDATNASSKAKGPTKAAVIRQLNGAEETSQERLMKKQLPAWVISGAVHVAFISFLILIFGLTNSEAKMSDKLITASVEKPEEEEAAKNLTNEDPGIDSELEASVNVERIDEQVVEAAVTSDPIGAPNSESINQATYAAPGAVTENATGGFMGTEGNLITGAGGGGGLTAGGGLDGRSGATKDRLLREGGGNAASELAVARGLAWLAKKQKGEGASRLGYWEYDGEGAHKDDVIAATGMAILPFLAAGETHKSGKKYQQVVSRGIEFLKSRLGAEGHFYNPPKRAAGMYSNAIGAMALIECYGMTKDPTLKPFAQSAVNFIQKAQAPDGSWGYSSQSPGDTSIVGWQIQALHSAKISKDLVVSDAVIKKANKFLDLVSTGSNKDKYGYRDSAGARPGTSLTAVGLLCRYYEDGWGPNNPGMIDGVKGLMNRPPRPGSMDMYYYYYATQVVHFFEGKSWKVWNEGEAAGTGMRDLLLKAQDVGANQANYGSWPADTGTVGRSCGRVGTTALSLLTLEVYYRHLPLYKRNDGGGLKELDRNAGGE